jgi:hypothetical protein
VKYLLDDVFFKEITQASKDALNQACIETLPHIRQSISPTFARFYFPNSVTNLSNCTADEIVSIFFMVFVLMYTGHGKNALFMSSKMTTKRMQQYTLLFEWVLCFLAFFTSKEIDKKDIDDGKVMKSITSLVSLITKSFPRSQGQGWNLSKIHELRHYPEYMKMFGSPSNFDTGPCERMHKEIAKQPGRRSQKRHATFTFQAATR